MRHQIDANANWVNWDRFILLSVFVPVNDAPIYRRRIAIVFALEKLGSNNFTRVFKIETAIQ
jgi:hypothetical protein